MLKYADVDIQISFHLQLLTKIWIGYVNCLYQIFYFCKYCKLSTLVNRCTNRYKCHSSSHQKWSFSIRSLATGQWPNICLCEGKLKKIKSVKLFSAEICKFHSYYISIKYCLLKKITLKKLFITMLQFNHSYKDSSGFLTIENQ